MSNATTLSNRALIRLSGKDVRGFLQGLVTNDVTGDLPVWAGLLSAQGKAMFDFLVWAEGDDLLLDCETSQAEALAKRLTLYRLRRPIEIGLDESLAVHWSLQGDQGVTDPRLPALGRRWLAPKGEGDASDAWRAHRLSLGVCEGAEELTDILWLECNATELNGVSFKKGCFVGQENTARMNWRSKINRRLVVVKGEATERVRASYPELGLTVVHARVDAIPDEAIMPDWLAAALNN